MAAVLAEGWGRSVLLKAGLDGSIGCASGDEWITCSTPPC